MPAQNPTLNKVRVHDSIVGGLYMISLLLALKVNMSFIWIAVAVAALQIVTLVTSFCPVYFVLNKFMPGDKPLNGPGA